jgi:hypothetical protein
MEKVHIKLGAGDIVGVFLGLLSWLFPSIPEWIKIGVTLIVMLVAVFLAMSKSQRTAFAGMAEKTIVNYSIPFIAGAFKAILVTTIVIALAYAFFNIHLVNYSAEYLSGPRKGSFDIFFHTIGNLTKAGNIILLVVAILGGLNSVGNANKKKV